MDNARAEMIFWGRARGLVVARRQGFRTLGRLLGVFGAIFLAVAAGRYIRNTLTHEIEELPRHGMRSIVIVRDRELQSSLVPETQAQQQVPAAQEALGKERRQKLGDGLHGVRWELEKVQAPVLLKTLSPPAAAASDKGGSQPRELLHQLQQQQQQQLQAQERERERPTVSRSTSYRLRGTAGHPSFGEFRGQLEGPFDGDPGISSWAVDWSTRLNNASGVAIRPSVSLSHGHQRAALKVSKPVSPDLQLHSETALQHELSTEDRIDGSIHLRQSFELEAGAAVQAALTNTSLPFNLVLGTTLTGGEFSSHSEDPNDLPGGMSGKRGPLEVYARLRAPAEAPRLKGWSAVAELLDSRAGALRAFAQKPWRRGGSASSAKSTLSSSGTVLSTSDDGASGQAAEWSVADSRWSIDHHQRYNLDMAEKDRQRQVHTSTDLRLASDGGSAALHLANSPEGLSEEASGWNLDLAIRPSGWSAHGGVNLNPGYLPQTLQALGSPRYAVQAQGRWREAAKIEHEVKLQSPAGESLWLTWRPRERGRKLSAGIELR